MDKESEIKLLEARIGNLEVQLSEYRLIVQELSDKLKAYEHKMGSVFLKSDKSTGN